jgi:hypothetical protein
MTSSSHVFIYYNSKSLVLAQPPASKLQVEEPPTREQLLTDDESKSFKHFIETVRHSLPTAVIFLPGIKTMLYVLSWTKISILLQMLEMENTFCGNRGLKKLVAFYSI